MATLYDQISKLKAKNAALVEKNKQLIDQLERKKRELLLANRPTNPANAKKPQTPTSAAAGVGLQFLHQQDIVINAAPTQMSGSVKKSLHVETEAPAQQNATDSNLLEIARKYKAR